MSKRLLIITILILFIGVSITPSAKNIAIEKSYLPIHCYKPFDDSISVPAYTTLLDTIDNSEKLIYNGKIAYANVAYSGGSGLPEGPCYFALDDPGNITSFWGKDSPPFFSGGTWTTDGRWFGCEYNSGWLWEINPSNGDMCIL